MIFWKIIKLDQKLTKPTYPGDPVCAVNSSAASLDMVRYRTTPAIIAQTKHRRNKTANATKIYKASVSILNNFL